MLNALKNQYFKFIPGNIIKNLLVDLANVLKISRTTFFGMLALGFLLFLIEVSEVQAQEDTSHDVWVCMDNDDDYDEDEDDVEFQTAGQYLSDECDLDMRDMSLDEISESLINEGYEINPLEGIEEVLLEGKEEDLTEEQLRFFAIGGGHTLLDCTAFLQEFYDDDGGYLRGDVIFVCPSVMASTFIAEEVLKESDAALSRQASSYYSRTVLNRVRTLRAASKSGFSPPSQSASKDTATGINAGDDTSGKVIDNIAVSLGASETRSKGRFKSRAMYLLATTDKVINTKSVIGFGVGLENSRVNFGAGMGREGKSAGVTLTAYGAHILNDNFFVAPQFSAAYLRKRTEQSQVVNQEDDAWRMMGSLALVGQHAMDNVELSGVGQVVYTHENTEGTGGRVYVGQSLLNGEVTYTGHNKVHPYLGVTGTYDFVRSASTERFGYEISAGLRAAPGSRRSVTLSVAYGKRDDEKTKSGNLFLRVFW